MTCLILMEKLLAGAAVDLFPFSAMRYSLLFRSHARGSSAAESLLPMPNARCSPVVIQVRHIVLLAHISTHIRL